MIRIFENMEYRIWNMDYGIWNIECLRIVIRIKIRYIGCNSYDIYNL